MERDPSVGRQRALDQWLSLLLMAAGAVGLVWHMIWLGAPMADDAATSVSYGLSLFHGNGLRLTPLSQRVEAFSNPLWVFLSGLSVPLQLEPIRFTQILGEALGVLALVGVYAWGPLAEPRGPRLEDAAAGLSALVTSFAYWSASGMETGLEAFLLAVAGLLLLIELRTGRGSWTGLALALLCLTRPEGVLFAAAAGLFWLVSRGLQRRWPGRQELGILAWLFGVFGGYLLFRSVYFASWLPNTYFAKRHWDFSVRDYFGRFFIAHGVLVVFAGIGVALGLSVPKIRARAAVTLLFTASGAFFAWFAHGDWMRESRFFAPLVPILSGGLAVGLSAVREIVTRLPMRRLAAQSWIPPLVTASVCGLVTLAEKRGARIHSSELKLAPEFSVTWTIPAHERARQALSRFGMRRPLVALADIGGAGLVWRNAEVIDAAGLGDVALAHHAGNLAAMEDYLMAHAPAIIDAHGPSGHLRDMRRLMQDYVQASAVFPELREWNGLWVRRGLSGEEDARCPGGKAPVLALNVSDLIGRMESVAPTAPDEALRLWRCAWAFLPGLSLPELAWRKAQARAAEYRG